MENGHTTACRTLILLLVLVFASRTVSGQGDGHSEDAVRYYTGLRVGDTVDVGTDDTTMFRVIAFSSSNACLSCTESLESIWQLLSMHGSVSMTLIVNSSDRKLPARLKQDYGWQFDVEIDPLKVYHKAFKVLHSPLAVVANADGVVIAVGPVGTSSYDWSDAIQRAGTFVRHTRMLRRGLEARREIALDSSEMFVSGGLQRQITFLDDSTIALHCGPLRRLAVYSTSGSLRSMTAVRSDSAYAPLVPLLVATSGSSNGVLLYDMDASTSEPILVAYKRNLSTRCVARPRVHYREGAVFGFFYAADRQHDLIATSVIYRDSTSRASDRAGCILWNANNGRVESVHDRDSIFDEADLSNYYWTSPWVDDEVFASLTNLSNTVRVYSRRTKKMLSVVVFDPDTAYWRSGWRRSFTKLTSSSTLEERKSLAADVSSLDRLMRDEVTGAFYVSFYNTVEQGVIEMYIVGPLGTRESKTQFVGRDHLCHRISNGVLYTSHSRDGRLYLDEKIVK